MTSTELLLDDELFQRAQAVAQRRGVSLAELVRQSLEALVSRESANKPWMAYAGIVEGEEGDSDSVDEIVYGRESP